MEKKLTDNEPISKPKPTKKDNRIGSKTAPLETDFVYYPSNNLSYRILTMKDMKMIFQHIITMSTITQ